MYIRPSICLLPATSISSGRDGTRRLDYWLATHVVYATALSSASVLYVHASRLLLLWWYYYDIMIRCSLWLACPNYAWLCPDSWLMASYDIYRSHGWTHSRRTLGDGPNSREPNSRGGYSLERYGAHEQQAIAHYSCLALGKGADSRARVVGQKRNAQSIIIKKRIFWFHWITVKIKNTRLQTQIQPI